MKLIIDHVLTGKKICTVDGSVNSDGISEYNIESVYEMELDGQKWICLKTWTLGSVPPEYRSHGQIEWENISLDDKTEFGRLFIDVIKNNISKYNIKNV